MVSYLSSTSMYPLAFTLTLGCIVFFYLCHGGYRVNENVPLQYFQNIERLYIVLSSGHHSVSPVGAILLCILSLLTSSHTFMHL